MKTVKLVFTGVGRAELKTVDLPEVGNEEVLVRNRFSLISAGTELALYTGRHIGFTDPEIRWARYPLDPGYASVGEVIKSGSDRVPPGSMVIHYGTHARESLVSLKSTHWAPVPPELDLQEACFARFAQIAYSSVAAALRPAGHVLVYGAGIIGNLAAQWFRLSNSDSVLIRDLSEFRLNTARACGLEAIGPGEPIEVALNTVVEATGVPAVVNEALSVVSPFGQVLLLGSSRGTVEVNTYKMIHRKAVVLSGAHETILGDSVRSVLSDALKRLNSGTLRVTPLITHTITPKELPGMYGRLPAEPETHLGVFVDWSA